jgi:hypothetical protein
MKVTWDEIDKLFNLFQGTGNRNEFITTARREFPNLTRDKLMLMWLSFDRADAENRIVKYGKAT